MMRAEQRSEVELEVRRILSKEELELRKSLSAEISAYRDFLQSHFRMVTWALGLFLIFASSLFAFLFGKSYDNIKERVDDQVDQKVIEYRIVDALKEHLRRQIDVYARSDETQRLISASVDSAVKKSMGALIDARIVQEIGKLETETIERLFTRSLKETTEMKERLLNLESAILATRDGNAFRAVTARECLAQGGTWDDNALECF